MRVVSGSYTQGMKMQHVRLKRSAYKRCGDLLAGDRNITVENHRRGYYQFTQSRHDSDW